MSATIQHHVVSHVMILNNQVILWQVSRIFVPLVFISVHFVIMGLIVHSALKHEFKSLGGFVNVRIIRSMMIWSVESAEPALILPIVGLVKGEESALIAILRPISY